MKKLPDGVVSELRQALLFWERPSEFFEELRRRGELAELFPELHATIGVPQPPKYHAEGDVWTHTMMVLDEAAAFRDKVGSPLGFMLSAVTHDLGKPLCTKEINGQLHSFGHETSGLPLAEGLVRRVSDDEELVKYVLGLVEQHMKPNVVAAARSSLKATNRMFDRVEDPEALIYLAVCDGRGKLPRHDSLEEREFLFERLSEFCACMSQPKVTKEDLIAAGVPEDERMAEHLEYAHKLHLAGVAKDSALRQTLALARKHAERGYK